MLAEAQLATLHALVERSSEKELLWMSGYLAGLVANPEKLNGKIPVKEEEPFKEKITATETITLLYGTETGNAKKAALKTATELRQAGLKVKPVAVEQYKTSQLEKETQLLVVISTQGEGEPPIAAKPFYDFLHEKNLDLNGLHFSVLALGSKAYPLYCQTGIDIEQRLLQLGAKITVPLQTCDEDFEPEAMLWTEKIMHYFTTKNNAKHQKLSIPEIAISTIAEKPGKKIFEGIIRANFTLNDTGSKRHTHHIEIESEEPFIYETGDAIGIVPENRPALVKKIIDLSGLKPNEAIAWKNESIPLETFLASKVNLLHLNQRKVKAYAALTQQDIPDMRMDFYDLLRIYPPREKIQEALQMLDGLTPRIYTLSSSFEAHGNQELHLTVLRTEFEKQEETSFGLCSAYLCEQAVGTKFSFFLHRQKNFRLPANPETPIIMIGPGTGIAPFRAFLSEREILGAAGKNWLFFGEENFITDFYYQTEIQNWQSMGLLEQVDLSFEKGTSHTKPVEQNILEQGARIWERIQEGGYVYVSGDKEPMSVKAEAALLEVISLHGNQSPDGAKDYLKQLAKENRYAKDVY